MMNKMMVVLISIFLGICIGLVIAVTYTTNDGRNVCRYYDDMTKSILGIIKGENTGNSESVSPATSMDTSKVEKDLKNVQQTTDSNLSAIPSPVSGVTSSGSSPITTSAESTAGGAAGAATGTVSSTNTNIPPVPAASK